MDEEEKPKNPRFQTSTVWWGVVGIVIVGALGTYVYLNDLQGQYSVFRQNEEVEVIVNTNLDGNINYNQNVNPVSDSDNDGLIDGREEFYGTDPFHPDTDGDGFSDGFEVINGFNPLGEGKLQTYGQDNETNTNSGDN